MMHTLKQMLAEADSQLGRLDEAQAEDIQVIQTFIEDVPRFMGAIRTGAENLIAMTHEVERDYLDALTRLQARMADRRAMMRDAGAIAQESPGESGEVPQPSAEEHAARHAGVDVRKAA